MSLGVACISTDCPCGGPAEVIEDCVNGILVKTGDTDGLAHALEKLLSDKELMESMGRSAHETMKDYRPEVVNPGWESYYLSVIDN
jgi:glycosyltransferase involved in cell wall biosynthesis